VQALLEPVGGNQTVKEKARGGFVLRKKAYSDILPRHVALPHEKSVFVLFTQSFVSKYFSPLHQDHLFSHIALHNKWKLLSCVY
jgi:hypothetical protein